MALFIGVDPGAENGLALWYPAQKTLELNTLPVVPLLMTLQHYADAGVIYQVIVEDPRVNRPPFRERYTGKEAAVLCKISQDIGANKRTAEVILDWCQQFSIPYRRYLPAARQPKWDAAYFKQVTGYAKRTNQHERDAARLVYGLPAMRRVQTQNRYDG